MLRAAFWIVAMVSMGGHLALAQLATYQLGRAPTAQEIRDRDTYVGPSGEGMPQGKGTAKEGAKIFAQKCALCHGATGVEGKYPKLKTDTPRPFATSIWSMINSSMPRSVPDVGVRAEKLPTNDVYALTAFVLYLNGLVGEDTVVDHTSLPKIKMPTRNPQLDSMVEAGRRQ
jgi:cytochrome c